jgi:hypothetical protein
MRFGISGKILPGVRLGFSFGGRRRPRVWASENLGHGIRVSESKSVGGKKRRRT